ncbi:biotin/lipoyl-containing protein [Cesiribacter andamanensis]|uniref:Glutaconyl-CoA decarboxylase subunit gamma n=1 Tax=Cesiribacter andamanensis AMV16 TaxID=1279009 RepID=M7P0D9_9BACT|nr:acetyl-CoA carboxylase biotin carboxyl carrier protein subunit [Cesiribacter andamanensis]EMR04069.1 Glutaconyl-CoA decarboxylase subunit gamma [Cesiribacter andamanensis AMV16]
MYQAIVNNGNVFQISQTKEGLSLNDTPLAWDLAPLPGGGFHILVEGRSYQAELVEYLPEEKVYSLKVNGKILQVKVKDRYDLLLDQLGMSDLASNKINQVKAPMPGLILDIKVSPGDTVKKGDPLLILEAMKMENVLKSPGDGQVQSILVKKGESVEKNQILIQF